MATFAKKTFDYASYAAKRPIYPQSLYNVILEYHQGLRDSLIDLGCGHGVATRALAPSFSHVTALDPSPGMLDAATSAVGGEESNITWIQGTSTDLPSSVAPSSVDIVIASQAAHWFTYPDTWKTLREVIRPKGMVAFWGYGDPIFPDHRIASEILHNWAYGQDEDENGHMRLGPYWSMPGRQIVERLYGDITRTLPFNEWNDVNWLRWEPANAHPFPGEPLALDLQQIEVCEDQDALKMEKRMSVGDVMDYVRTWSAYHAWSEDHQQLKRRSEGGAGDVVDWMFDEIAKHEQGFAHQEQMLTMQWPVGMVLARRALTSAT